MSQIDNNFQLPSYLPRRIISTLSIRKVRAIFNYYTNFNCIYKLLLYIINCYTINDSKTIDIKIINATINTKYLHNIFVENLQNTDKAAEFKLKFKLSMTYNISL